jgi:hypothetical protein
VQSQIASRSRSTLRIFAFALSFALLFDQFTHAATPPHRLTAALQHHAAILAAQQARQTPPAPIERQNSAGQTAPTGPSAAPLTPEALARQRLLAAHTLYLARSTQDANFPASPDDAYNLVLANLRNWGHYQIVDSIAQADLVLQLRDAVHANVVNDPDPNSAGSTVYYLPSFQLTLADPSTLSPLWTVSSGIPTSIKGKQQDALLAASAQNLVSQLKLLAGDSLTAQDEAAQKQITHYNHARVGLAVGLAAAGVALSLGLFFLFKHKAQDDQAAFCRQHNLSPCPGA